MHDCRYFQIGILLQFETINISPEGEHVHRKFLIESSTNINVYCVEFHSKWRRLKHNYHQPTSAGIAQTNKFPTSYFAYIIYYTSMLCSEFRQFYVCCVHHQCIDLHATFFGCILYKNDAIRIFPFPKYFPLLFVTFG